MHLLPLVLGFSLESPLGRRLAENNEPCKQSCDSGHDRYCDQQNERGEWTMSCDLHPTTSCDDDCHYPPPSPLVPWMGASGTHPSPPPPPPPPEQEMLVVAWIYFLAAMTLCLICSCYGIYHYSYSKRNGAYVGSRSARERIAYWCCCCVSCWRGRGDYWDEEERDASAAAQGRDLSIPPVMIK